MGCKEECFNKVSNTIKECVRIKKEKGLSVTLGIQMVLMPQLADQIIPIAKFGKKLGVDYSVIKHCSDDETGALNIDYSKYSDLLELLKEAETYSDDDYLVKAKWSKIKSEGKRRYSKCYGPPFIMQLSGSGTVAPCGMLFNRKFKRFHIGNLAETSFKDLWKSDRYWEIMDYIASNNFDPRHMCGTLCLQDKVNEFLWDLKHSDVSAETPAGEVPMHKNFV